MTRSSKAREVTRMKVVGPSNAGQVSEGKAPAVTERVLVKETRKGPLKFLVCRITSPGKDDDGQLVEFLLPRRIHEGSAFYEFVTSATGKLPAVGDEVDPQELVGHNCVVEIRHVSRSGRAYSNAVSIWPRNEVGTVKARERR